MRWFDWAMLACALVSAIAAACALHWARAARRSAELAYSEVESYYVNRDVGVPTFDTDALEELARYGRLRELGELGDDDDDGPTPDRFGRPSGT